MNVTPRAAPQQSVGVTYCGAKQCPVCRKKFRFTEDWGYRIGAEMYCSYACVRAAEKRVRKSYNYMTEEQRSEALRLNAEGVPTAEIAKTLGRAFNDIRSFLRTCGRPFIATDRRKYRFDRKEIEEMREQGKTWEELGKRYGCSAQVAYEWHRTHKGETR